MFRYPLEATPSLTLPLLEWDRVAVCGMFPTAKFLAEKLSLAGETPKARAQMDVIVDYIKKYHEREKFMFKYIWVI